MQEILYTNYFAPYIPAVVIILLSVLYIQFNKKPTKPQRKPMNPDVLFNFNPEPLIDVSQLPKSADFPVEKRQPDEVVSDPECLNLAKINYLNMLDKTEPKEIAEKCIRSNGVGSCGPRGFYGTIDIHLNLERRIAEFMNMEECVLYSYGFCTTESAIAAYCKKSDILFCDEMINFSAKQGCLASRAKVIYFKHNDVEDLQQKLIEYERLEAKRNKLFRKFLIVEGLYQTTGTLAPLPQLMELRKKYKLRIFIDECLSIGVLGETGRGATEHFNIDRSDVDMIIGSLEGSLGSIGGFCVGASVVIEHQRLSGLGYCFSASLPPFLSQITIAALDGFDANPNVFGELRRIAKVVDERLGKIRGLKVVSWKESPMKVLKVETKGENVLQVVKDVQSFCESRKLYLARFEDSLQMHLNLAVDDAAIDKIVSTLREAATKIVP